MTSSSLFLSKQDASFAHCETPRVAVALSGGVDSLYTLMALHDKGIPVMGVHGLFAQHLTFKKNNEGTPVLVQNDVKAQTTVLALQKICQDLGISFHSLDCGTYFYKTVISPFIASYAGGQTPNPCALCNAQIKFGFLLSAVQELGATHLATGHYARLLQSQQCATENTTLANTTLANRTSVKKASEKRASENKKLDEYEVLQSFFNDGDDTVIAKLVQDDMLYFTQESGGKNFFDSDVAYAGNDEVFGNKSKTLGFSRSRLGHPLLLQGADGAKDQSYFLSLVPAKALNAAVFPLGAQHKNDIVSFLHKRNITPPEQKESQEVCFIPNDAYRKYLPDAADYFGITLGTPGAMVVLDGNKQVGTHKGLWQYTEGQRKGLGIGWKEPLYVVSKNVAENVLYLGTKKTLLKTCLCHNVNISVPEKYWPEEVFIKTRYRETFKKGYAKIVKKNDMHFLQLHFIDSVELVAPGQVGAVYAKVHGVSEKDGRPVFCFLAGGIITEFDVV